MEINTRSTISFSNGNTETDFWSLSSRIRAERDLMQAGASQSMTECMIVYV